MKNCYVGIEVVRMALSEDGRRALLALYLLLEAVGDDDACLSIVADAVECARCDGAASVQSMICAVAGKAARAAAHPDMPRSGVPGAA
jgi:hypothetical protein